MIHAPSDTMGFYDRAPQRLRAGSIAESDPPPEADLREPAPPPPRTFHEDCPDVPRCAPVKCAPWPWERQHPAIEIADEDLISDSGKEIYNAISHFLVDLVAIAGVHADRCVLDRPFGLRQLRRWGIECVLLGDLTEAFWPEDTATILGHIDRNLCPVRESADVF